MREPTTKYDKSTLLARDVIPAVRSINFTIDTKLPPKRKLKVLRKAILKCKKEESKRQKEEKEKQRKEAETRGLHLGYFDKEEMNEKEEYYDEKIAEGEKRLESLNRDKHKLFLILKQVLQNDKKKMQIIATKKAAEAAANLEKNEQMESTNKLSISGPHPHLTHPNNHLNHHPHHPHHQLSISSPNLPNNNINNINNNNLNNNMNNLNNNNMNNMNNNNMNNMNNNNMNNNMNNMNNNMGNMNNNMNNNINNMNNNMNNQNFMQRRPNNMGRMYLNPPNYLPVRQGHNNGQMMAGGYPPSNNPPINSSGPPPPGSLVQLQNNSQVIPPPNVFLPRNLPPNPRSNHPPFPPNNMPNNSIQRPGILSTPPPPQPNRNMTRHSGRNMRPDGGWW